MSTADEAALPELRADLERLRPNVSGDLRTLFRVEPLFRSSVRGYDRFQVDTYVRWAEDELTAARRDRQELLGHAVQLRADLDEARRMLAHSPGGREALRLSWRIGTVLAQAADEADGLRADAAADRETAAAEAQRLVTEATAEASALLDTASAQAREMLDEATAEADRLVADAQRQLAEADLAAREARTEAEARLEKAQAMQRQAEEEAARLRCAALADASATRAQARDEVLRMLAAAREDRRRAETEPATRRLALQQEIDDLEQRRAVARAELDRLRSELADALAVPAEADVPAPREVALAGHGRHAMHLPHFGLRRSGH